MSQDKWFAINSRRKFKQRLDGVFEQFLGSLNRLAIVTHINYESSDDTLKFDPKQQEKIIFVVEFKGSENIPKIFKKALSEVIAKPFAIIGFDDLKDGQYLDFEISARVPCEKRKIQEELAEYYSKEIKLVYLLLGLTVEEMSDRINGALTPQEIQDYEDCRVTNFEDNPQIFSLLKAIEIKRDYYFKRFQHDPKYYELDNIRVMSLLDRCADLEMILGQPQGSIKTEKQLKEGVLLGVAHKTLGRSKAAALLNIFDDEFGEI